MPIAFQTGTTWTFQRFVVYSCPVSVAGTSRKNVTKTSRPKRQRIVLQIQGQKQRHNVQSQDQRQRSPYRYLMPKPQLTMRHILWPMTHVTNHWPVTRVTHDSRLLTSHCHSVTFRTLGRGKGVSMRFNSISYCAYALPPRCTINLVHIS